MIAPQKFPCSCTLLVNEYGVGIEYCPRHKAGPELYKALADALDVLERRDDAPPKHPFKEVVVAAGRALLRRIMP